MPYARRNLRKKGPKVSLKQKNYIKFRKGSFGSQAIKKVWDNKKTIRQNYERLGLCTDVNAMKSNEESNIKPVIEFVPQEVVKKENLRMNMFDQEHVRNLIERYGEDYEAMFRDIKLNVDQWSVGQIKKKCALYKKILAQVNEKVSQKKEKEEEEDSTNMEKEEDESLLEE